MVIKDLKIGDTFELYYTKKIFTLKEKYKNIAVAYSGNIRYEFGINETIRNEKKRISSKKKLE